MAIYGHYDGEETLVHESKLEVATNQMIGNFQYKIHLFTTSKNTTV